MMERCTGGGGIEAEGIRIQSQSIRQRDPPEIPKFRNAPLSARFFLLILLVLSLSLSLSFSRLGRREWSWSPLPLVRTHLIYGLVYASHGGARAVVYRLPKARERHNGV